ncbi:MAG TPA: hypothetical protein VGL83_13295 [Stellaceae bacterium]|jgi:hypothetical protein
MSRWFALLGLLLLAGCQASSSPGADSIRTSSVRAAAPAPQAAVAPQPQLSTLSADGSSFAAPSSSSAATALAADQAASAPPTRLMQQQAAAPADTPAATTAPQPPRPAPYKQTLAAYIKRYARDPASLQQAKIGQPFAGTVNGQNGSIVCVEMKGAQGTGAFRTAYLLQNNRVIDSKYDAPACHDQQLEPW